MAGSLDCKAVSRKTLAAQKYRGSYLESLSEYCVNFQPLFTTARVVTATYRVISTTLLLLYLARRVREKRPIPNATRRRRELFGVE